MSATTMAAPDAVVPSWTERNQRWLAERIAFWREQLSQLPSGHTPQAPVETDPDFESAAARVRRLFGLSAFETELLIVTAGVEIDAGFRAAVATAQGVAPREAMRVTFSLALSLCPQPHWDAISPLGPLRHWSLLDVDTTHGVVDSRLRIDERVLHYMTGVAGCDDRLAGIAERDKHLDDAATPDLAERITSSLTRVLKPLVLLVNATTDASRRRLGRATARAAFHGVGLRTLWVRVPASIADARDAAELGRRIDREALLTQCGVALS